MAIYERIAPRTDASGWYRFHLRQALWFGTASALVALVALFWPLLLSFVIANTTAILWIYGVAILLDMALFVAWLTLAIRCSRRAGRGELFDIRGEASLTGTAPPK